MGDGCPLAVSPHFVKKNVLKLPVISSLLELKAWRGLIIHYQQQHLIIIIYILAYDVDFGIQQQLRPRRRQTPVSNQATYFYTANDNIGMQEKVTV